MLVGMGRARGQPVDDDRHAGNRDRGGAGATGPGRAGMFRCAAPGYVSALYQAAGLRDVAEWDVGVELVTNSPAQYWEMLSEHVSLAVAALAQVSKRQGAGADREGRHRQGRHLRTRRQGKDSGVARCIVGTK